MTERRFGIFNPLQHWKKNPPKSLMTVLSEIPVKFWNMLSTVTLISVLYFCILIEWDRMYAFYLRNIPMSVNMQTVENMIYAQLTFHQDMYSFLSMWRHKFHLHGKTEHHSHKPFGPIKFSTHLHVLYSSLMRFSPNDH